MEKENQLKISDTASIIEALRQMDDVREKALMICDGDKFINLLTIGDLQRAIIAGQALETAISEIQIEEKLIGHVTESKSDIVSKLKRIKAEYMPVIDDSARIVDIIYWKDEFSEAEDKSSELKDIPVVIMSGGLGTRLRPITNIIPKPLIPLRDYPIMHHIMKRFENYGANLFLASVNYKWEMIKKYFDDLEQPYDLQYFVEDKPLGTAGSLSLMRDQIKSTFFVSNCDIIIEDHYGKILDNHYKSKNDITLVACLKSYDIPYGVIETDDSGLYTGFSEKPTFTHKLNTGMYILEAKILDLVPDDQFFHITDLIAKAHDKGYKIGVFPITEKSWIDIGEWTSYLESFS